MYSIIYFTGYKNTKKNWKKENRTHDLTIPLSKHLDPTILFE